MLIVFCVVLGAGMVSKGTLFFMLAQMKPTIRSPSTFNATNAIENGTRPLEMCRVNCGGHFSEDFTCRGCPQGMGAGRCNGDCAWNSNTQQCETKTATGRFKKFNFHHGNCDVKK